MPSPLVSPARAIVSGAFARSRARTLVAVAAIALGVALGYAVRVINQAATNELALGVQTLSGDADLEIGGPRGGFDEALYADVAGLPQVAVASPVVEVEAKLAGRPDTLRIVGLDAFRAARVQPALVPSSGDPLDILRPDVVFLSPAARQWLGTADGDTLQLQSGLDVVSLRIAGTLGTGDRQRFAVMDIAGVQSHLDRLGRLTRIDLRLRPGVDVEAFRESLARTLPAGLAVARPAASLAAGVSLSRAYRVNLDVLALVALFTGGLLVFSTQALAVVRRRSELALLRVLGVTRRRMVALLVAEGAVAGALGSLAGLAAGHLLARLAIRVFGADLGSGYFPGLVPTLAVDPLSLTAFFGLGVATAVLGSLVPALEAAHAPPASALKAGDEQTALARLRSRWPGVAMLTVGAVFVGMPPVGGLPVFGYLAIVALLIGTLMLMPRLAAGVLAVLPVPRAAPARLALLQLRGAPGQVSVSLAAIVASVGLMVSMAIMVASFRHSLDDWLGRILPADVYVRAAAAGDTAFLSPEVQARIAALPGVERAEFLREERLLLDPARPRVVLLARPVDAADPGRRVALVGPALRPEAGAPPPMWVSEAVLDVYGFAPGQVVSLPLGGKAVPFTVAGVWRDYGRTQGAIIVERERYVALTGDRTATNAALWLAPGTAPNVLRDRLKRELPGGEQLEIAPPSAIRVASLQAFDRTFAVTYALELAAVVIGLFGLSSSFGALVLARRREFGVLRHLGMTRRQVGAMLATEGLVVSGIGLAVGLVLGWVISLILIHVVNRQSFHWGMDLALPWPTLAAFTVIVLLLSTLTALASGQQAMGEDVVRAVKEDW
jgi:putative ABC transport system permease protein